VRYIFRTWGVLKHTKPPIKAVMRFHYEYKEAPRVESCSTAFNSNRAYFPYRGLTTVVKKTFIIT